MVKNRKITQVNCVARTFAYFIAPEQLFWFNNGENSIEKS